MPTNKIKEAYAALRLPIDATPEQVRTQYGNISVWLQNKLRERGQRGQTTQQRSIKAAYRLALGDATERLAQVKATERKRRKAAGSSKTPQVEPVSKYTAADLIKLLKTATHAARSGVKGREGVERQDIADFAQEIFAAVIGSKETIEINVDNVLAVAKAAKVFSLTAKERGTVRGGDKALSERGAPEVLRAWQVGQLEGDAVGPTTSAPLVAYRARSKIATSFPSVMKLAKGTPAQQMQFRLFSLHEGKEVFPSQPKKLAKKVWAAPPGGKVKEKVPLAYKDLLEFHGVKHRAKCPTCFTIARYIKGVSPDQVTEVIDALIWESRQGYGF